MSEGRLLVARRPNGYAVSPALDASGGVPPPRRSYGCAFVVRPDQMTPMTR